MKIEGNKPAPEVFEYNAQGKKNVEKIKWKYFNTSDVIFNQDGNLPETDVKLYSTMWIHINKLKNRKFFKNGF